MTSPHSLLVIYGWFLGFGAVAAIVVWGIVWMRVDQSIRGVPTLRLGETPRRRRPAHRARMRGDPRARRGARHRPDSCGRCVPRRIRQLRVVLALDRCTDDTASLARAAVADDERFEFVEIDACPADWAGKVHAIHAGVTRSRGAADADYLLFADADTEFAPGCIAASLALMRDRDLDLLSLLSTLTHRTWFERVVQPAATMELMRQFPLTLANARKDRRPFANGQFLLFTRNAYEEIGGHAAVKSVTV